MYLLPYFQTKIDIKFVTFGIINTQWEEWKSSLELCAKKNIMNFGASLTKILVFVKNIYPKLLNFQVNFVFFEHLIQKIPKKSRFYFKYLKQRYVPKKLFFLYF